MCHGKSLNRRLLKSLRLKPGVTQLLDFLSEEVFYYIVEVLDCLQQSFALPVPLAFLGQPGLEVEPLLPLVLEHGVKLVGQGGNHPVFLGVCAVLLGVAGICLSNLLEEVEYYFLKFLISFTTVIMVISHHSFLRLIVYLLLDS